MGWDGLSHIAGSRYRYRFGGAEYLTITDSNSLDVTGSFSFSFMLKPEPSLRLTYAILSKGHPTNFATGSWSMESINGFLRIYLHCNASSKSLVYDSNSAILNTNQIIHLEVVWDYTAKLLTVYKNSVSIPITINTSSGNFFTLPSQMGLMTITTAAFEFGRATGKVPFLGRVYDYLYLSRARTSSEVFIYYESIKYLGSYPEFGTIVFSSTRNAGQYQLFSMKGDGTDQQLLLSSPTNDYYPAWSPDGTKVVYNTEYFNQYLINGTGNSFYTITSTGGNKTLIESGSPYSGYPDWMSDGNLFWASWGSGFGGGVFPKIVNPTTGAVIKYYTTGGNLNSGSAYLTHYSPAGGYFVYIVTPSNFSLFKVVVDGSFNFVSQTLLDFVASDGGSGNFNFNMAWPKISPDGTKITYTKRSISTAYYQIYVMDSDGGNIQQLTGGNYNSKHSNFSPDGTKIIFNNNSTGVYQIYIMNLNGSNVINISNNAYDDYFGDWKA